MANDDFDRRPRWNTSGYWTDRSEEERREDERREAAREQGRHDRVRNYDREDMRRYGERAQEQAERLRSMRGQESRGSGGGRYSGNRLDYGRGRSGGPGSDRYADDRTQRDMDDNFWGMREHRRRHMGDWQNTVAGRSDLTSARDFSASGLSFRQPQDWELGREYDMDPGYDYEFGTDFDFMDQTSPEEINRRRQRQESRQRQGSRQQMPGRSNREGRGAQSYSQRDAERRSNPSSAGGREPWNTPGPFTGVGPQGYQRSDQRIQEEICEIFTRNGRIDAREIEIQVAQGEVTLQGGVDRKEEKYLAEEIASRVNGVRDIHNRLRVQTGGGQPIDAENRGLRSQIRPGMRVAGVDGKHIGLVQEVSSDGFTLDRPGAAPGFIPFRAVKRTDGQIILRIHADEIDRQGWKRG